jgi:hypothetical protein
MKCAADFWHPLRSSRGHQSTLSGLRFCQVFPGGSGGRLASSGGESGGLRMAL